MPPLLQLQANDPGKGTLFQSGNPQQAADEEVAVVVHSQAVRVVLQRRPQRRLTMMLRRLLSLPLERPQPEREEVAVEAHEEQPCLEI